ncbi:helix-turn-helix domain-containing protein [Sphingobacterium sp. IITKGP-BTPF85]|uniref:helix-turn-helix domain-containing protein n=1 Tax=Sphingobacterium sp. IITKGP-BTPF85 TaxID=1338009 RepID=UPI000422348A|nr:helix-turn-helix domain-containing protein [Sphingobacterium sp. IITKGP-BTPF85]
MDSKMLELLEEELFTEGKVMEICVSMLQCILLKIIKTDYEVKAPMSRQLDIAFRFREVVQKFHTDHKNVLFYANLLHISENYLNKCVKEATNKPPKQWINEISILHSQILLQDATRDIAGIAFEMKYKSPSYLHVYSRKSPVIHPVIIANTNFFPINASFYKADSKSDQQQDSEHQSPLDYSL